MLRSNYMKWLLNGHQFSLLRMKNFVDCALDNSSKFKPCA